MTIYGRWGIRVHIMRLGTLEDVLKLDGRKPDEDDRLAVEAGSYVVTMDESGRQRLYHRAYLRADGGIKEIVQALDKIGGNA